MKSFEAANTAGIESKKYANGGGQGWWTIVAVVTVSGMILFALVIKSRINLKTKMSVNNTLTML